MSLGEFYFEDEGQVPGFGHSEALTDELITESELDDEREQELTDVALEELGAATGVLEVGYLMGKVFTALKSFGRVARAAEAGEEALQAAAQAEKLAGNPSIAFEFDEATNVWSVAPGLEGAEAARAAESVEVLNQGEAVLRELASQAPTAQTSQLQRVFNTLKRNAKLAAEFRYRPKPYLTIAETLSKEVAEAKERLASSDKERESELAQEFEDVIRELDQLIESLPALASELQSDEDVQELRAFLMGQVQVHRQLSNQLAQKVKEILASQPEAGDIDVNLQELVTRYNQTIDMLDRQAKDFGGR